MGDLACLPGFRDGQGNAGNNRRLSPRVLDCQLGHLHNPIGTLHQHTHVKHRPQKIHAIPELEETLALSPAISLPFVCQVSLALAGSNSPGRTGKQDSGPVALDVFRTPATREVIALPRQSSQLPAGFSSSQRRESRRSPSNDPAPKGQTGCSRAASR